MVRSVIIFIENAYMYVMKYDNIHPCYFFEVLVDLPLIHKFMSSLFYCFSNTLSLSGATHTCVVVEQSHKLFFKEGILL